MDEHGATFRRTTIICIAAMFAVDAVWLAFSKLSVDWTTAGVGALGSAVLIAGAILYTRFRPSERLAGIASVHLAARARHIPATRVLRSA